MQRQIVADEIPTIVTKKLRGYRSVKKRERRKLSAVFNLLTGEVKYRTECKVQNWSICLVFNNLDEAVNLFNNYQGNWIKE